jgi:hypothetical protein
MLGKSARGIARAALRKHVCCTRLLAWVKFQSVLGLYLGSQGLAARATNQAGDPFCATLGVAAHANAPASEKINVIAQRIRVVIVMIVSSDRVELFLIRTIVAR